MTAKRSALPAAKPVEKGIVHMEVPWEPCVPKPGEHQALRALMQGEATKDQQFLVVEWMRRATGIVELEFRPDERASAFAGGKRFIGVQFFSLAKSQTPTPR